MPTPQEIVILGTGGNSVDILDCINELNRRRAPLCYRCIGFLDDDEARWGEEIFGVPVLGPLAAAGNYVGARFVNGIGSPTSFWRKKEIIAKTQIEVERFETIIHPSASVSTMAHVGRGVAVLQQVTVANRARIGDHVMILPNSIVSHDDEIGDYTTIAGGVSISSRVRVGQSCYIGANATIIGDARIGDLALVGMGAVVLRDVPRNTVVVGNPARFLRATLPETQD